MNTSDFVFSAPQEWASRLRAMRRSDPIYKPALLLVMLDLIDEGLATATFIPLSVATERFDVLLSRAGLLTGRRGPARGYQPAFHLSTASETTTPFWHLLHHRTVVEKFERPQSQSSLFARADAAAVLPHLQAELGTNDGRERIRQEIYDLLECDGRDDCLRLVAAHDRSHPEVESETARLTAAEEPFVLDDPLAERAQTTQQRMIRDRALRKAVRVAYGEACSLCRLRLRYDGRTEAEAAHIKPRAEQGVDDLRNALSLCRTHHWAFDEGLWSAKDDYTIIVRAARRADDDITALEQYAGKELRLPDRPALHPHPSALAWHVSQLFNRAA